MMNLLINLIIKLFNQVSAILNIKIFNPENLIVQHLPVKERVNKNEINRMQNGYIITL